MENFTGLKVFATVAETCSFVEAGRRLGLSASAIGKAVARLEQRLGARLLQRSTHHMRLTGEGALFLDRCRRILGEMELAAQELSEARGTVRGPVRVSLPSWALTFMPTFRRFMQAYPDVRLDLDLSDRLVDLLGEGYDLAIRTGDIGDSRLTTRTIGRFRHAVVASPAYLASHGVPQRPEDLFGHLCLHRRHPQTGAIEAWPLAGRSEDVRLDLPVKAIIDSVEARIELAAEGAGIACVPAIAVARPIEEGRLIGLLQDHVEDRGAFRLLWAGGENVSRAVRTLVDFVVRSSTSQKF